MGTFHVVMTALAYPGVLFRMLIVQLLCRVFRCKVSEIRYFSLSSPCCEVKHEKCSAPKSFWLCFIPFFICITAGLPLLTTAALRLFHLGDTTFLNILLFWFGFSLVCGSMPDYKDAQAMWRGVYANENAPLAAKILLAPISAVLYAGGWLFGTGLYAFIGAAGAVGLPYLAMLFVK